MTEENKFKVSISGPGTGYKADISKELAAYILGVCINGEGKENNSGSTNSPILKAPMGSQVKESVAEYVHAKGPGRNPDKILAIAGYLVKNGNETFSPDDIRPQFPKIGEPIPGNFGRDFSWVLANGWIAESDQGQNLFYITNTGNKVIESNFSPEEIRKTKQKSKLKYSKKGSKK